MLVQVPASMQGAASEQIAYTETPSNLRQDVKAGEIVLLAVEGETHSFTCPTRATSKRAATCAFVHALFHKTDQTPVWAVLTA